MRVFASALLLFVSACLPTDAPGDAYGVYDVVGSLNVHECGQEAVPVSVPYQRVFELRRMDTGLAYLIGSDGSSLEGSLGTDGAFRFSEQQRIRVIDAEEVFEVRGCDLVTTLTFEGVAKRTVDADTDEVTLDPLKGKLLMRVAPAPGSDCSELLFGSASGGQFHALPCHIAFDLEGKPRKEKSDEDATASTQ